MHGKLQSPKIEGPCLFLGVQSWVVPNSPNFMCIPGTNSTQKPYAFSPFLERKRKEREKIYLPKVNYIIIGNPVVYITALKTLKERENGTAPVDPCRPQNRGSHDYLRAHKGS